MFNEGSSCVSQISGKFLELSPRAKIYGKKSAHPPLGLLTVASLLPDEWEVKLVDLNVGILRDEDIKWADYVFLSAMVIQRNSVQDVIKRCHSAGVKIVAGGPLFTMES